MADDWCRTTWSSVPLLSPLRLPRSGPAPLLTLWLPRSGPAPLLTLWLPRSGPCPPPDPRSHAVVPPLPPPPQAPTHWSLPVMLQKCEYLALKRTFKGLEAPSTGACGQAAGHPGPLCLFMQCLCAGLVFLTFHACFALTSPSPLSFPLFPVLPPTQRFHSLPPAATSPFLLPSLTYLHTHPSLPSSPPLPPSHTCTRAPPSLPSSTLSPHTYLHTPTPPSPHPHTSPGAEHKAASLAVEGRAGRAAGYVDEPQPGA